ncbi:TIGR02569 family protein [Streptomyces sp. NPDC094448]|uniref:TIGR02569 family protein n=1 Tax=Streptomyces sp. NPDC094448 TaxID=3366063 RepID=UPI00382EE1B3
MDHNSAPPAAVLAAFGATGPAVPLSGGQGRARRCGALVLKPVALASETPWRAGVLCHLPDGDGFRVARPVPAADGSWSSGGWEAWRWLPGAADPFRPDEVIRAGAAFHTALAGLPRPRFLDVRNDPWARADRLAFGDSEGGNAGNAVGAGPAGTAEGPGTVLLKPLLAERRPVSAPSQLVHGDLLNNVLFAPDAPPVMIDWALYWRPTAWAAAVVAVDAICWWEAGAPLLERWSRLPEWRQMLLRALVFRIAAHTGPLSGTQEAAYARAVDLVLATAEEPR